MTPDEMWNNLLGIYAYDTGSTDSGIHNETLRARCVALVNAMSEDEIRLSLSRWVRDTYLSEASLAVGYGWEDVHGFLDWIDSGDFARLG